ncbi:MAG: CZB domain-containing protein [Magnetococcales bacterium]|nr:CZB domain-containing protein [Magnetococcales bacterium]
MNKLFENQTLIVKLSLVVGVLILSLVAVGTVYENTIDYSLEEQKETIAHLEKLREINQAAGTASRCMLQARRAEKDFLMRRVLKYSDKVAKHVECVNGASHKLAQSASDVNENGLADTAKLINEYINVYHNSFKDLVKSWEAKGLDHKSGYQGDFRKSAHNLEMILENLDTERLFIDFLQMRRREKDFVARGHEKYMTKWGNEYRKFQTHLAQSRLSKNLQREISTNLLKYKKSVNTYAKLRYNGIVPSSNDPRYKAMSKTAHGVDSIITSYNVPNIWVDYLMLRRYEKDYLARGSEKYVQRAKKRLEKMRLSIKSSTLKNNLKQQTTKISRSYEKTFLILVDENDKIKKLISTMREAVHAIEPLVEDVQTKANSLRRAHEGAFEEDVKEQVSMARILGAAVTVIGLLFAWFVVVGILRQLGGDPKEVAKIVDQIADGDLTIQATGKEAGLLGRVFRMKKSLEELVRNVILQSFSLSAVISEERAVRDLLLSDTKEVNDGTEQIMFQNESLDATTSRQKQLLGDALEQINTVAGASEELSTNIRTIATGAVGASQNVNTMAAAAEEMSANVEGVSSSLAQVNDSVTVVSGAVKEMTSSLDDVRTRCRAMSEETNRVESNAQGSKEVVNDLSASALEIGKVIGIINDIAEQTNMLALNASIEAAGAGEAGKGFAVVANEVKELARQTGEATQLISENVGKIQSQTQEVSSAVNDITSGINKINSDTKEITQAVDDQGKTTEEINASMNNVSEATEAVTRNVNELQTATNEVAKAAAEVASENDEIANSANEGANAANEVSKSSGVAKELADEVWQAAEDIFTASVEVRNVGEHVVKQINNLAGSTNQFSTLTDVIDEVNEFLADSTDHLNIAPPPFNIEMVKKAHLSWLGKLEHVIRGRSQMDPKAVASGHECDFGKWYYSEGESKFGNLAIFQKVGKVHLQVHECARGVVQYVADGKTQEAINHMDDFNVLRKELFELLDTMYKDPEVNS